MVVRVLQGEVCGGGLGGEGEQAVLGRGQGGGGRGGGDGGGGGGREVLCGRAVTAGGGGVGGGGSGLGDEDGEGRALLVLGEFDAQVGHEFGTEGYIHVLDGGKTPGHFRGTVCVSFSVLLLHVGERLQ